MINLRYHIVSIAAVFLALAVGVVLGSTTLSNTLLSGLSDQKRELAGQVSDLETQRNALNAKLNAADRFAAQVGPSAVRGLFTGRPVVFVTTADARPSDRDALRELITASGGSVVGEVQLTEAFGDPARADELRNLVTRLIPAGVQLPTASDPGTLAGGLLGSLLLLNRENKPQANSDEIAAAMTGLSGAGFVKASPDRKPAQLAVVLTGGALAGNGAGDRAAAIARFATQLQRTGAGTVLAGRAGSADGSGPIGVVRADTAATAVLSTVDNADTAPGRIATVLALREQLEGHVGQYGTAGNAQSPAPVAAAG
jgi:hypothetical protein